ncbi:MAG: type II secretion system protein GspG [Phycisphaerales bacterium]
MNIRAPVKRAMRARRAMTLVEVLAVVVILGLIAGTLLVGFSGSFGRARHELAKTGIGVVVQKLELLNIAKGGFPAADVGLAALTDGQATPGDAWYLGREQLLDPWNRPYLYLAPGPDGLPYEVVTLGADGVQGGRGEDADVTSARLREGAASR